MFFQSVKKGDPILEREPPLGGHLIDFCPLGSTLPIHLSPNDFEKKFEVTYLPVLAFESESLQKKVKKESDRLIKIKPFGVQAKWQGVELDHELEKGVVRGVVIKWINEAIGYGAFASRSFNQGEFIGEYTGVIRPYTLFCGGLNPYCFRYPTFNYFFNVFYVDSQEMGNETRFMNHSDTPSCEPWVAYHNNLLHIILKTARRVEEGEELTFSYH